MSIEQIGVRFCDGTACGCDPHYHQIFIYWPDEVAEQTDIGPS